MMIGQQAMLSARGRQTGIQYENAGGKICSRQVSEKENDRSRLVQICKQIEYLSAAASKASIFCCSSCLHKII